MYQVDTSVKKKDLLGQCQAFLKIWGLKVMVTTWPNMDKDTALEPQLHSNIKNRNVCLSERLNWAVLSISENFRVKGLNYHMTKYGQNHSFGFITPSKCTRWQQKTYCGRVKHFWKSEEKSDHQMTKYGQKCSFIAIPSTLQCRILSS